MIHAHAVKNLRRFNNKPPVFFVTNKLIFLPLSLGMIRASLEKGPTKDLLREYLLMPFLNTQAKEFWRIAESFSPGMWLFSDYFWSEKFNLEVSRQLKEIHPDNLIIHGGPNVPRRAAACQSFLRLHPCVDLAVLGEGEMTASDLFSCLVHSSDLIQDLKKYPESPSWRQPIGTKATLSKRRSEPRFRIWIAYPLPISQEYLTSCPIILIS
jgi:hypothetical protein